MSSSVIPSPQKTRNPIRDRILGLVRVKAKDLVRDWRARGEGTHPSRRPPGRPS